MRPEASTDGGIGETDVVCSTAQRHTVVDGGGAFGTFDRPRATRKLRPYAFRLRPARGSTSPDPMRGTFAAQFIAWQPAPSKAQWRRSSPKQPASAMPSENVEALVPTK